MSSVESIFTPLVRKNIDLDNSILLTDEYRGYFNMSSMLRHKTINHSENYVDCLVHTNTIESFWSLVKRGIVGQYHKVSAKYLSLYLDEFCYRFNARFNSELLFDDTIKNMVFC